MNYYDEIKKELVNNEVYKKVKDYSKNKNDLKTYYNVGKLLDEAGSHYGEGIINKYSKKLTDELGKGYGISNLKRMRLFYYRIEKGATMSHYLNWSHYYELIKFDDIREFNYYVKIIEDQTLSVRELRERIQNKEYERLDYETKLKLANKQILKIEDLVKSPILVKNKFNSEKISEKMLQELILEDLPSFLKELGEGFCFIENEYKIKIGDVYNYIDLLLFNYFHNRFAVVELKTTELKKEHIGQIETYMHYIDENVKKWYHDKTIGIIICRKNNKYIMAYCSDEKILSRKYELV